MDKVSYRVASSRLKRTETAFSLRRVPGVTDLRLAQNYEEIIITDDAVVDSDEFEIVEELSHTSDVIQLVEEPKETELNSEW